MNIEQRIETLELKTGVKAWREVVPLIDYRWQCDRQGLTFGVNGEVIERQPGETGRDYFHRSLDIARGKRSMMLQIHNPDNETIWT